MTAWQRVAWLWGSGLCFGAGLPSMALREWALVMLLGCFSATMFMWALLAGRAVK